VHAYNRTTHETTGVTPYQLLFGTKPKLLINHVFNWSEDAQAKPAQEYVMNIQEQIPVVKTHELIQKNSLTSLRINRNPTMTEELNQSG